MNKFLMSVLAFALTGAAFGSGFTCEDTNDAGYRVKYYNQVSTGTRNPGVLIISDADADPSTQLVAKGSEISKSNRANTVRYTVDGSQMDLKQAILQVSFKEGREILAANETVEGQLILVAQDGSRDVLNLVCTRYLKGAE